VIGEKVYGKEMANFKERDSTQENCVVYHKDGSEKFRQKARKCGGEKERT
jgi:hypothetical protein